MSAAMAERASVLPEALERLTVVGVGLARGYQLRVGAQRSPFREDHKPSFSILKDGQGWKDHATGEGGKVWAFAKLCWPNMSQRELALHLINLAGLGEGTLPVSDTPHRAPVVKAKARKFEHSEEWAPTVLYRWMEGIGAVTADAVRRLAARRGWPDEFVHRLIGMDLLSYPLLPWHDYNDERSRRGWAFKVERLIPRASGQIDKVAVGYHQTFEIPQADGKARKSWVYVPYAPNPPAEGRKWSVFQELLAELEQKVAPYPFYIGSNRPKQLYIFEGQWDAATFDSVMRQNGWEPREEVAVLGLRGNQSVDVTMECLRGFIGRHRPQIALWPDNDKAGETWTKSEIGKAPSFRDRLLAAGASDVCTFRVQQAKDLNDLYRLRKFTRDQLFDMMANAIADGSGKVVLP